MRLVYQYVRGTQDIPSKLRCAHQLQESESGEQYHRPEHKSSVYNSTLNVFSLILCKTFVH